MLETCLLYLPRVQESATEALEPNKDHPRSSCNYPQALWLYLALGLVGSIMSVFMSSVFMCPLDLFSSLEVTVPP